MTREDQRALFRGLLEGRLVPRLVLQPIADLGAGRVAGFEALARFPAPFPARPDVVLAEAAALGVAAEVEALLLRSALTWRGVLPPDTFLTVNLSPHLLTSPPLRAVLDDADLHGVFVELTEHVDVEDGDALRQQLDAVRSRGARIAMDDAGSGYSGLTRVLALRPDLIKLDKALVSGLASDPAKVALVRLLSELSGELDAWLLAEGVETPEELDVLCDLEVPLGQGYLLGRPADQPASLPWPVVRQVRAHRARSTLVEHLTGVLVPHEAVSLGSGLMGGTSPLDALLLDGGRPRVLVDEHGQPSGLAVLRAGGFSVVDVLVVPLSTAPEELAVRMATRPEDCRLDPAACVDAAGRFVGVVPVPALLLHLAARGGGSAPRLGAAPAPGLLIPATRQPELPTLPVSPAPAL